MLSLSVTLFFQDGTSANIFLTVLNILNAHAYIRGQVALMKDIVGNFVVPRQAIKRQGSREKIYLQIIAGHIWCC